jgi:hypothetical protein
MNPLETMRMAGTNLKQFFTDPANLAQMGKKAATEAALSTAVQQTVPYLVGGKPSASIPRTLAHAGIHAAASTPITGALQVAGMPDVPANIAGQIVGAAAASRFSQSISPEVSDQPNPEFQQLLAMQKMNAEQEQQRFNNQIQLAYARNYSAPSFIHHSSSGNPAEIATRIAANATRPQSFGL